MRRTSLRPLPAIPIAALLLLSGACGKREESKAASQATRPGTSSSVKRFTLRGVVKAIDPVRAEVTVDHEEIPGYMAAMTMAFPAKDEPQVLELLRSGDRIEATLVVEDESYWIERILTKGFVPTPPGAASSRVAAASTPVVTPEPNRAVTLGQEVPDFALIDQTGSTVRLSQMRGEPVAVTFLYTRCPIATACPMTASKFSKLDAKLREKKFGRLLVVTIEPERDTPEVLAAYAKKMGADPARWKFLTGQPQSVAKVASSFGVMYYPERGQVIHSQAVAVVDPRGRLATIYYGESWQPEHLLRDLEKARNR